MATAKIPEPEYEFGDAVEVRVNGVWRSAIIADGWYQQTFDQDACWAWIYSALLSPGVPDPFHYVLRTSGQCRRA